MQVRTFERYIPLSLESLLSNIGKQCRSRKDATESGVNLGLQCFLTNYSVLILKRNIQPTSLKLEIDSSY